MQKQRGSCDPSKSCICDARCAMLHVTSYGEEADVRQRRVLKISTPATHVRLGATFPHAATHREVPQFPQWGAVGGPTIPDPVFGYCVGWLDGSGASAGLLQQAWGISFSSRHGACITCHGATPKDPPLVRLPSCGCNALGRAQCFDAIERAVQTAWPCGEAAALVTEPLDGPNCVVHVA